MILSVYGLAVQRGLTGGVTLLFPPFAGGFEFAVAGSEDCFMASFQFVLGRDVAKGRVQTNAVVMLDELCHDSPGVFRGQRRPWTDAFLLEDTMPAFDLAVALRVVGRGPRVRHAADADELLEVPGDELGAVVGDDSRRDAGKFLPRPLDDLLDVGLGHGFADLPVDGESATAIEEAAQVVEGAGDVEVGDINVPVFVRTQRLHEAVAFAGGFGRVAVEQASLLKDAVDAGRTTGGDVLIEHHESQSSITLQRKEGLEVADGLFFLFLQPVVAWNPGIVFVGLAIAVLPRVPLGGGQAEPQQEASDAKAGLVGPTLDEIDDVVACIVGNPQSV